MTIKEEIEIMRGEPIEVLTGNPMDIPCIETSDSEKLCKNPVVSVHMITYNHEPYIRQAIEGVMMQKTDFEFELVIGEDASTDKTRELCFEYQKKYPNKIRVLWWHENLNKFKHPAGGNGKRNMAHCRGEFFAICEGDDYWTDPLKLQKQVDIMRKYPDVGLVFTNGVLYYQSNGKQCDWDWEKNVPYGLIDGRKFLFLNIYSHSPYMGLKRESHLCTASAMIRAATLKVARMKYEILSWKLMLGDVPIWLSLASISNVYGLPDKTVCYRQHEGGACATLGKRLWRDNLLVRIYFNRVALRFNYFDLPPGLTSDWVLTNCVILCQNRPFGRVRALLNLLLGVGENVVSRQLRIGHVVSQKVIEYYARYCDHKLTKTKWCRCDRCYGPIKLSVFCRVFMPDSLKRLWRKVMHHGEFE